MKIKLKEYSNLEITDAADDSILTVDEDSSSITVDGAIYHNGVDITTPKVTKIGYLGLKNLRDTGQLIPGMKYRITDFVTNCLSTEHRSAKHPFDIIVEAIDNHTLDKNAKACRHIEFPGIQISQSSQYYQYYFTGDTITKDDTTYAEYCYNSTSYIYIIITLDQYNSNYKRYYYVDNYVKYTAGSHLNGSGSNYWWFINAEDGYFWRADLGSWKLKYTLDQNRFKYNNAIPYESGYLIAVNSAYYLRYPAGDLPAGTLPGYETYKYAFKYPWGSSIIHTESTQPVVGEIGIDHSNEDSPENQITSIDANFKGYKGDIEWMQDEWGNEAPFDFKNIQFKRYNIENKSGISDANFYAFATYDRTSPWLGNWTANSISSFLDFFTSTDAAWFYLFSERYHRDSGTPYEAGDATIAMSIYSSIGIGDKYQATIPSNNKIIAGYNYIPNIVFIFEHKNSISYRAAITDNTIILEDRNGSMNAKKLTFNGIAKNIYLNLNIDGMGYSLDTLFVDVSNFRYTHKANKLISQPTTLMVKGNDIEIIGDVKKCVLNNVDNIKCITRGDTNNSTSVMMLNVKNATTTGKVKLSNFTIDDGIVEAHANTDTELIRDGTNRTEKVVRYIASEYTETL